MAGMWLYEAQFFLVICDDGSVFVCRHPNFNEQRKSDIEKHELTKYHTAPIKFGCTGEEFSFITYDSENVCILWESFPDWWNAPSVLNMFDKQY